jgi:transporter family protein
MSWIPGWVLFGVIALVFWGISGVTQKLSTNRISSESSFLWFAYAMLAISDIIVFVVQIHWHVRPTLFWLAVVGGALNGLGALSSFAALRSGGKASIVIPLISLYPLLAVGFAVIFLHERLTGVQAAGIAVALVAAVLLSREPETTPPES